MNPSLVILCPGQGAQAVSMGKAWHAASPEARAVFAAADRRLGDRLGSPLSRICFEGPAERLNQTDVSQPAIYVTSVACWRALLAARGAGADAGVKEAGVIAAAGLSLGEYTALHIAGAFSFEDGLELVVLRGRAMQDAADAAPSGMVALIGADESQAQVVCDEARGDEVLVCANFNAPGQVVISGSKGACARAAQVAESKGLRASVLAVAGAFHSPLMASAADRLRDALAGTRIFPPRCTVISNVTALPHEAGTGGTIEDLIRARLVDQLTMPVRWSDGCSGLISRVGAPDGAATRGGGGAGSGGVAGVEWHELAPGKTLSGLMKRIDRSVKVESHDEPVTTTHT
jgi:[acyl-carrier-protein] S-malonyltransferase